MEFEIREGCRFHLGDVEDGYDCAQDDSSWQSVILPHDWAIEHDFSQEYSSGTGYLPGGIGWYRIHINLPEDVEGKSVQVIFDGVYKHASVWCNNYFLGNWANGYTAFSFDISHAVRSGENLIAVKVEHEDLSDSRWYSGSGIEKPVLLRIQEACHAVKEECTFETINLVEKNAFVCLRSAVRNDSDKECQVIVQQFLDGENIGATPLVLPAGEDAYVENEISIDNGRIWSVDEPNLIDWAIVVEQDGRRDETVIRTGIRSICFDPKTGFFLNNQNMKLKGVCLHEDAGSFGNAVPRNVWRRRLEKLKGMGTNTIRMAHNAHDKNLYDLCDEMGFLVIDEVFDEWEGPKNKWHIGHNVYPPKHDGYNKDYPEWHEKDLESFVKTNRNRPSVIMWSIGNEIDYPNDPYCHPSFQEMTGNNDAKKPAAERKYSPHKPNMERLRTLAMHLCELVKKQDCSRPVTMALAFPELSSHLGLCEILDVVGYNYKEQFYEQDHERFPQKPFFGSENGHEYEKWLYVIQNDYVFGQCLWTGIDYLGETRGWPEHGSRAGHLTTSGEEKPDYYFRKSLWTEEPMIKLATCPKESSDWMEKRRFSWNYPKGEKVTVEVYSNLEQVELFLNGKSLGLKERDEHGKFVYLVSYANGTLTARAKTRDGKLIEDSLTTSMQACQIQLRMLDKHLKADGVSVGQIEVTALDANRKKVNEAELMLHFSVEGEGELLHIDNGDLSDTTSYTAPYRRTYRGNAMLYVRSTHQSGEMRICVNGDQIVPSKLIIQTER